MSDSLKVGIQSLGETNLCCLWARPVKIEEDVRNVRKRKGRQRGHGCLKAKCNMLLSVYVCIELL